MILRSTPGSTGTTTRSASSCSPSGEAILDADERVAETIKWKAPTFVYRGNIASFYPKTKTHASLMFHRGAELDDPDGLLEGEGDVSRVARFVDADDLAAKADALQRLIRQWIALRDGTN